MRLIQLHNGSWVNPRIIDSIIPVDGGVGGLSRIIFECNDRPNWTISCVDYNDAKRQAAEIARQINLSGVLIKP